MTNRGFKVGLYLIRSNFLLVALVVGFCNARDALGAVLTVPSFEITDSSLTLELGGTFAPESTPLANGRSIFLYANGGVNTDWVPSTQFYSSLTTPGVTSGSLAVGTRTFPGQLSVIDGDSGNGGDYVQIIFDGGNLSSGSAASGSTTFTLPEDSFANTAGLQFSLYWGSDGTTSYQGGGKLTDISPVPEPGAWGIVALSALCGFVLRRRHVVMYQESNREVID